ncbi:MAG: hypothetical protein WDN26_05250 [Chitinophagaceae bacterium]
MLRYLFILMSVVSLLSCSNSEIGNSKDVNPESVYFDYKVWGDEDDSSITVRLQYRFGGPNGTTLLLEDPSKAELDGMLVPVDSSRFLGAYYEVMKPVQAFEGKHSILFTDLNKKEYKEEFDFPVIFLKKELPAVVKRNDLTLEIGGLKPGGKLRILFTDTSFYSRGIEKLDTIPDGTVLITKADLNDLKNGPIHLEIIREEDKWLGKSTKEGGKLSLSYGLKREFVLED